MTWSELPKEYKDLEKTFDLKKVDLDDDRESIVERFSLNKTPQGSDFWNQCHQANTISELPIVTLTNSKIKYTEQEVLALILKFNNDKPGFFPATDWFNKNKKS